MTPALRAPAVVRSTVSLLLLCLFLAGCARVPTSGPIEAGKGGHADDRQSQQIQVFAQRPQQGWTPAQVVSGFLAAMASRTGDHEVARSYLTPDIESNWPSGKDPAVRVYAQDDDFRLEVGRDDTVTMTATEKATISGSGEYRPSPGGAKLEAVFRLQRVGGEWRIGSLPDSLMLSASDAVSAYSAFDAYFFGEHSNVLVPNAIVLPVGNQESWPTDLMRSLINGPTPAVASGVESAIPADTVMVSSPTVDEDGLLTVQLGGGAADLSSGERDRMVAQITATMMRVEGVSAVEVEVDGEQLPARGESAYDAYDPSRAVQDLRGYFVRDGKLVSVDPSTSQVRALGGPFGAGALSFTSPAVSLDSRRAAGLSSDGNDLWVGGLAGGGSATKLYDGTSLSAPSWDRYGDLWVVENAASGARLLRFVNGEGEPRKVSADGLDGSDVSSVRVAWGGVRVAFVGGEGSTRQLRTGVLDRAEDQVTLRGVRSVAPSLSAVRDVWWYDARTLAVAAREQSDLRVSYLVSVDGLSLRKVSSLRDLDRVAAASGMPLLVSDSDGRIALSSPDEYSSTAVGLGSSPIYPG